VHAELFYCPYCGEEDLYPGDGEAWHCAGWLRSFTVTCTAFGPRVPHPAPGAPSLPVEVSGAPVPRPLTAGG
jgi:hypothetical protein